MKASKVLGRTLQFIGVILIIVGLIGLVPLHIHLRHLRRTSMPISTITQTFTQRSPLTPSEHVSTLSTTWTQTYTTPSYIHSTSPTSVSPFTSSSKIMTSTAPSSQIPSIVATPIFYAHNLSKEMNITAPFAYTQTRVLAGWKGSARLKDGNYSFLLLINYKDRTIAKYLFYNDTLIYYNITIYPDIETLLNVIVDKYSVGNTVNSSNFSLIFSDVFKAKLKFLVGF
jgi:hypothetical protein